MLVSKLSLVEQKKQQWAREREEMSHLYLPWGPGSGDRYISRQQARNQFASTLELHHDTYDYSEPIQRQRSPSLPPIHHTELERIKEDQKPKEVLNRNISSPKRFNFYDEDAEGDTSGYGSETINHIRANGLQNLSNSQNPVIAWQQDENDSRNTCGDRPDGLWSSRSPRSGGTTADEGRPRWGDRGVATGRLWEPTAPNARLPQMPNQKKGTPSWVERGLNMIDNAADVLVIDQRSSANSGFECDRSSYNGSDEGKTYLRGQNVPLEPEIKAQRENKRIKALELQNAILNQLEDQEKRRQEEREMKLREERLEELRIQRQQEADKIRMEEEKRRNEEKQIQEQRKLDTLKKALEEAEKKAKLEKEKRFSSLKQNLITNIANEIRTNTDDAETIETTKSSTEPISPSKSSITSEIDSAKSQKKDSNSHQTTGFSSPLSSITSGNLNLFIHSVPPMPLNTDTHNQYNIVPIGINGNGELVSTSPNSVQLAVLVPQNLGNNLYSVSLNSFNTEISEAGKILTPRKYRIPKTKDVCTQTDPKSQTKIIDLELERNIDKDYPNIDENAPQDSHHNPHNKDRRYRSEERYKKDLENRPKWGVNRPAAQYKKQSEKDPFYSQKRKMRQKYRAQARQYLSQSSDDSRSPSPPTRSDKSDNKARNSLSQSYWKSKRPSQDNNITKQNDQENSNMISGDFNNLGLTAGNDTENKKSPKMSPSKRITLSQKFINDKYGNRKMWIDEANGRSNTFLLDPANRKKLIDQLNMTKRDFCDRNDEQDDKILSY